MEKTIQQCVLWEVFGKPSRRGSDQHQQHPYETGKGTQVKLTTHVTVLTACSREKRTTSSCLKSQTPLPCHHRVRVSKRACPAKLRRPCSASGTRSHELVDMDRGRGFSLDCNY
ncbi:hypothetical protein pipiens_019499 [Culex pipiens pipiens]|uniref:Uncharacterized protein n=1 Tax=Culex pipiens pipiens TaxID=38569 RepID=A0ABD1DTQ3_CULPP